MKRIVFIFLILTATTVSAATEWQKITIPGTRCGDGKPYNVLIQKKDSQKLYVEFMGGGVCWDYESCFPKKSYLPWLHNYPVVDIYSVLTANKSDYNPFKNHSKIYFGYCTADVYAGNHVGYYKKRIVYHYGARNIHRALEYLQKKNLIKFSAVDNLAIYGSSAGGIAALVHGKYIESFTPNAFKKTLIIDSPGLHFGKKFWKKFDDNMKKDFKVVFNNAGLDVDFNDGAVSKKMGPVLETYREWNVGFMYGLRDIIMSTGFGEITPANHKKLILSHDGLPYIAKDFINVKFWLKDTMMHTFMLMRLSAKMKSQEGESAHEFVQRLYEE